MKSLIKSSVFNNFLLKASTDLAILISRIKTFQSLGAEATKARPPRVDKVLKFGWDSSIPSSDRRLHLDITFGTFPSHDHNVNSLISRFIEELNARQLSLAFSFYVILAYFGTWVRYFEKGQVTENLPTFTNWTRQKISDLFQDHVMHITSSDVFNDVVFVLA